MNAGKPVSVASFLKEIPFDFMAQKILRSNPGRLVASSFISIFASADLTAIGVQGSDVEAI